MPTGVRVRAGVDTDLADISVNDIRIFHVCAFFWRFFSVKKFQVNEERQGGEPENFKPCHAPPGRKAPSPSTFRFLPLPVFSTDSRIVRGMRHL